MTLLNIAQIKYFCQSMSYFGHSQSKTKSGTKSNKYKNTHNSKNIKAI